MKKLSQKQKTYHKIYSERKHRHELKRKARRKELRIQKLPQKVREHRAKNFLNNPSKAKHQRFDAPKTLSLISSTENTLRFFTKAKQALFKGMPVTFNLKNVQEMGPETLTFFSAAINEEHFTNNTPIRGNLPDAPNLRRMFVEAGFYNFVKADFDIQNLRKDIYDELIHRITKEQVESELAGAVSESALEHSYGLTEGHSTIESTIRNIYSIIIECMSNTRNHASVGQDKQYNWWLLAYKEPETSVTKFCFLDLGIGIFDSIEQKHQSNTLPQRVLKMFVSGDNVSTLQKIFGGERKTTTEKKERGLGIHDIYTRVVNDKDISYFALLSNNVLAIIEKGQKEDIIKIGENFKGTLYYWELTPKNDGKQTNNN